ncbi:hypothetical protein IPA_05445 [Ignicoccus pacificus DSM 13166]|uniref:Sulfotransferase domain-containing protein n=1 Tax=Ignicoccus pacificus DSM 13166 TaxID=940294 RepID=A0A977KCS8_9CREN|nr:hypothetical protein IPA_05445 [Ignicoccus pacificus DSM 13166]
MTEKPIMINGFPRSGTTYLSRYLEWLYGRVVYEPLATPKGTIKRIPELAKWFSYYHPYLTDPSVNTTLWFFHNEETLRKFMEGLRGYPIKETTLHRFLGKDWIKEHWDVYHIIRDPVSVYHSFKNLFHSGTTYGKYLRIGEKLGIIAKLLQPLDPLAKMAKVYSVIRNIPRPSSLQGWFLMVWTFSNIEAIEAVGEDKLIIYNKEESFYKLPRFTEFIKNNPLRIRVYDDTKLENLFLKIAREHGFEREYSRLLDLFE